MITPLQHAMTDAILDAMDRQGMNQKELATASYLQSSTVSAILRGSNTGYLDSWQAMFDVLHIKFNFESV